MLSENGHILSQIVNSLMEFTNKNSPFLWGPEYTLDFYAIKKEIITISILRYNLAKSLVFTVGGC